MLHRAILGSMERFLGILIEEHEGKFPLWLAPSQIMVCPITTEANAYAQEVVDAMKVSGLRAEADLRNEKINYKVREHSLSKTPVILAVGKREAEDKTVSMRRLGSPDQTVMSLSDAVRDLELEARHPDLRN
jgi:threonyl-tRNA synthetase